MKTVRRKERRDTAANWTSINPILAAGEIGVETDASPARIKVGDGVTAWNSIGYSTNVWRSGSGAPSNSLGVNGDFYLRTSNGDVSLKTAGAYSVVANIKGADGTNGTNGTNGAGYGGTSTTSLAIATGTKAFTTQAGLAYPVGGRVRASSAANGANYMEGLVTSYSGTALTLNVTLVGGTGTFADWNFAVAGQPGNESSGGGNASFFASASITKLTAAVYNYSGWTSGPGGNVGQTPIPVTVDGVVVGSFEASSSELSPIDEVNEFASWINANTVLTATYGGQGDSALTIIHSLLGANHSFAVSGVLGALKSRRKAKALVRLLCALA